MQSDGIIALTMRQQHCLHLDTSPGAVQGVQLEHVAACCWCCCREWLQSLWQWLAANRHSLQPLMDAAWPLLPVLGSQLVPLQALGQSAVVLPGADAWSSGLAEVLRKLGVHVLDTAGFELPVEMLRGHCVHSASGTGVAAALAAALKLSSQGQAQGQGQQQLVQAADVAGSLTPGERQLLRSFLLQPTWYAGAATASPVVQLRKVARKLPLYSVANSCQPRGEWGAAAADAHVGSADGVETVFVTLEGSCCLAPAGMHGVWEVFGC